MKAACGLAHLRDDMRALSRKRQSLLIKQLPINQRPEPARPRGA